MNTLIKNKKAKVKYDKINSVYKNVFILNEFRYTYLTNTIFKCIYPYSNFHDSLTLDYFKHCRSMVIFSCIDCYHYLWRTKDQKMWFLLNDVCLQRLLVQLEFRFLLPFLSSVMHSLSMYSRVFVYIYLFSIIIHGIWRKT